MTNNARDSSVTRLPGAELLVGAVDCHVHACPHINARSVDVFQAVRMAADAGLRAIGLMDNFTNSAGLAALAHRELGHLGVEVFGGLIMEPPAGGICADSVRIALDYGYEPNCGARFISLPTHHTRNVAQREGRDGAYLDGCLAIPETGPLPDPLPEILDLIAARGVVFNTGHVSGVEAIRVTELAQSRGVERILAPSGDFTVDEVRELVAVGAFAEFSFFVLSHATQVGLTHVDAERHAIPSVSLAETHALIRAAGTARTVVSGDCGVYVLPPPVEGLREFLLLLKSVGFSNDELAVMVQDNPKALFRVAD